MFFFFCFFSIHSFRHLFIHPPILRSNIDIATPKYKKQGPALEKCVWVCGSVLGANPSRASTKSYLQPFQLLLEVVLIHNLDSVEFLLFFHVLLPHQLYLPEDLRRPIVGSPSGRGMGEIWGEGAVKAEIKMVSGILAGHFWCDCTAMVTRIFESRCSLAPLPLSLAVHHSPREDGDQAPTHLSLKSSVLRL